MLKKLIFRKKKAKEKQLFQNIILEFESGKVITASVPAFLTGEEDPKEYGIKSVKFTEPMELPDGCKFSL